MIVKLVIKNVSDPDELDLACKIHDYIENVLSIQKGLKHKVPDFDYEYEWESLCEGDCH